MNNLSFTRCHVLTRDLWVMKLENASRLFHFSHCLFRRQYLHFMFNYVQNIKILVLIIYFPLQNGGIQYVIV